MQKWYRFLWMGILVLVLCGCGKEKATKIPPGTPMPATQTINESTPPVDILSAAMNSMLLEGKLIYDMRAIPADLNPATQFDMVLNQYKMALSDDNQHLRWFLGAYGISSNFYLSLTSRTKNTNETIRLVFPLEVIVNQTEVSVENMNFIAPAFGGGGGAMVTFPSIRLIPGRTLWQPIGLQFTDISTPVAPEAVYDMTVECAQPGVFNIHINQTYTTSTNGATSTQVMPYDVILACPNSATVWMFNPNTDALETTQKIHYNNGKYEYQP